MSKMIVIEFNEISNDEIRPFIERIEAVVEEQMKLKEDKSDYRIDLIEKSLCQRVTFWKGEW